uniref:Uncharacterized protein n=1 Tax=Knipowitschia caucasica TaxID=637954 RepID=A0AAV2JVX8_KNICA
MDSIIVLAEEGRLSSSTAPARICSREREQVHREKVYIEQAHKEQAEQVHRFQVHREKVQGAGSWLQFSKGLDLVHRLEAYKGFIAPGITERRELPHHKSSRRNKDAIVVSDVVKW